MERYQHVVISVHFMPCLKLNWSALQSKEFHTLKEFKEILLSLKNSTEEAIIQIDNCQNHKAYHKFHLSRILPLKIKLWFLRKIVVYLVKQFILVLSTKQKHCFPIVLMVSIRGNVSDMLRNGVQGVDSNTTSNQKQIWTGAFRIWIKITLSPDFHMNFTANLTLGWIKRRQLHKHEA